LARDGGARAIFARLIEGYVVGVERRERAPGRVAVGIEVKGRLGADAERRAGKLELEGAGGSGKPNIAGGGLFCCAVEDRGLGHGEALAFHGVDDAAAAAAVIEEAAGNNS